MIFFIAFLGAITPGPDILLVLQTTLRRGFLPALQTLFGIATGWIIYITILYFGFAHLLQGDVAQIALGIFGGAYLLYLAFLLFRAKVNNIDFTPDSAQVAESSVESMYLKGLLINLSNPKAIIFFSAIITPFMERDLVLKLALLFLGLNTAFLSVIALATLARHLITNRLFDIIDKLCAVVFLCFSIALFAMAGSKWMAL